jgi:hypothetical protein
MESVSQGSDGEADGGELGLEGQPIDGARLFPESGRPPERAVNTLIQDVKAGEGVERVAHLAAKSRPDGRGVFDLWARPARFEQRRSARRADIGVQRVGGEEGQREAKILAQVMLKVVQGVADIVR